MDFTFFIAGLIAMVVGFIASIVFIARNGKSFLRLIAVSAAIAFVLDWLLLINWTLISSMTGLILLLDTVFFALYSVIGCSIGALPLFLLRFAWRFFGRIVKR